MTPEELYILYKTRYATYHNRFYKAPKDWAKIKERKDWRCFELLSKKSETQLALVNWEEYFDANLKTRGGQFFPGQFSQLKSFSYYSEYQKRPPELSPLQEVKKSLMFIAQYIKRNKSNVYDYFNDSAMYPIPLRHYTQGGLHSYILAYADRILGVFSNVPDDIKTHSTGSKNIEDYNNRISSNYLMLINSNCKNIIEKFMNEYYKR